MTPTVIIVSLATGMAVGFVLGWGAGKERTKSLLSYLVNKMERLRADSKIKVIRRDIATNYGDTIKAEKLTTEMSGESTVFYEIQNSISGWCRHNNEKDPFAL